LTHVITAAADVRIQDIDRSTPAHWCVGDAEMLSTVLARGADPNARTTSGNAPLHEAARDEKPAAVRLLIAAHADVNARNGDNLTPLHMVTSAPTDGHFESARLLTEAGADIDARDDRGRTAAERYKEAANYFGGKAPKAAAFEMLLGTGKVPVETTKD
jgi:ankyrin repeat protein